MNLIIDGNTHRVNNFIDFLIENYADEGKTYQLEIIIQDKYDRKQIEKRINTLKDNLLVFLNDEFEIVDQSLFVDYDKFITCIGDLFSDDLEEKIDKNTYQNHFVKYEIKYVDGKNEQEFSFFYLDLNS